MVPEERAYTEQGGYPVSIFPTKILLATDGSEEAQQAARAAGDEGLSVAEISRRIEGLPTKQLKKVREFEKKHKNRETLIEQIDRKIRANNNS